ncbi:hypothetical protein BGZ70_002001 [Mortierella alpina]|uniref:Enoyl reductase (ER) domain-containing protein n=1 Tax=Mortierella alpina TaxID=64518 RepID=A0A9P6JBH1_MORAP|nr:hypothetical protein BGZ70_002001 [Mortierella alpina]
MSPLSSQQFTNNRVVITEGAEHVPLNKEQFKTVTEVLTLPELQKDEIFVQNLIFSLDPYLRYDYQEGSKESSVFGFGISRVIASNNAKVPTGALVISPSNWADYSVIPKKSLSEVAVLDDVIDPKVPLSAYNGVLGVPGFTVWDSLNKIGDLKKGETIYISSAAGTLGQLAGQLAKRKGLRVIGSAGTDEKVAFLKNELGFDAAFNYKTQDKREALTEAVGEAGLDIYYDLVGDDTTEVALDLLNPQGRVVAVGILAYHQNEAPKPITNVYNVLFKRLRYEGYTLFDRFEHFAQFWREMTPLVASGDIKYTQTVVKAGADKIAETYLNVLNGTYKGKVNVQLAEI